MGGAVCLVHRNAILRFQQIPTQPAELVRFDSQMRELYNSDDIAQAVVLLGPSVYQPACETLAKQSFSPADRQLLFNTIESLYEDM